MTVFFVAGIPVEQGSKTGYVVGGRVVLVDSNKARLKPWRAEVTRVARATGIHGNRFEGAVKVRAVFVLPKPKSVKREYPSVRPDLDKLLRALFDGITDAEAVWKDDAQVVSLEVDEVYGVAPGVHVEVTQMPGGATVALPVENAA
jgi:Holliday junction resolvase RusA-like endonuclease